MEILWAHPASPLGPPRSPQGRTFNAQRPTGIPQGSLWDLPNAPRTPPDAFVKNQETYVKS